MDMDGEDSQLMKNGTGIAISRDAKRDTPPDRQDGTAASAAFRSKKRDASSDTQDGTEKKKRRRKRETKSRRTAAKSPPPPGSLEKNTDPSRSPQKNKDSKDSHSSDCSSPLRRPKSLLMEKTTSNGETVYQYNSEEEVVDSYHKDFRKYQKKLARQQQLPTLKQCKYVRNLTDWDNLKEKNAILDVAESVLLLSSSFDGKEINTCNGIIIEWDEKDESAIVVTSSQGISSGRCTTLSAAS